MVKRDLDSRLVSEISKEHLWKNISTLAKWQRHAGTPGERKAADYFRTTLERQGVSTTVYEFESLLGYPGPATLKVIAPEQFGIECITHGFGGRTGGKEVEGQVEYVRTSTLEDQDLTGRVTLDEGLAMGYMVGKAQKAGAVGTIYIQDDRFRDVCLSPVWGTPTTASAKTIPTIPCISIRGDDGERLKSLLGKGPVRVRLSAKPRLEWHTTPLVMGEVKGTLEPDRWVMLSGHYCSWYYGAVDNAAANSIMLEVARIISRDREHLRRTFRVFFWPGHSQGRFCGSTWYCDNFWEEIYRGCVAHINLDGLGATGAAFYHGTAMAEAADFIGGIVREIIGEDVEVRPPGRAGDLSFWGIGVPSLRVSAKVPAEMSTQVNRSLMMAPGEVVSKAEPGSPWYWHNPEDTLDKADVGVMAHEAHIQLLAVLRLCNAQVLPYNFERTADQIVATASKIQSAAGTAFDLNPILEGAKLLKAKAAKLHALAQTVSQKAGKDKRAAVINECLMALCRHLNPVLYTVSGPFEQDPANPGPLLPALQPAGRLARLPANGDQRRFLATELLRQRNRVEHGLVLALEKLEEALQKLA